MDIQRTMLELWALNQMLSDLVNASGAPHGLYIKREMRGTPEETCGRNHADFLMLGIRQRLASIENWDLDAMLGRGQLNENQRDGIAQMRKTFGGAIN